MTLYSPLVSGIRGGVHDDNSLGHIERRQTPFTHPMEDAMSPEQFDRLKALLEDIAASLPTEAKVADLEAELAYTQKALSDAQAQATEAEATVTKLLADAEKQGDGGSSKE